MDARILLSAIRSADVRYPVPYLFSVSLLFAVLCLGGAILSTDWLRILLATLGAGVAVSGVALVAYAALFRRELLRSEAHVLNVMLAQMIGDRDTEPAIRERLSHMVLDADDRPRPKSHSSGGNLTNSSGKDGSDAG